MGASLGVKVSHSNNMKFLLLVLSAILSIYGAQSSSIGAAQSSSIEERGDDGYGGWGNFICGLCLGFCSGPCGRSRSTPLEMMDKAKKKKKKKKKKKSTRVDTTA